MIMKMRRSHRYDIKLSQHDAAYSNIWSSVYEKHKQHWDSVEKSVAYKKSVYFEKNRYNVL